MGAQGPGRLSLAGRLRRPARQRPDRLRRRLRGDSRPRLRRAGRRFRQAETTTSRRSWSRPSPTAWPRRLPKYLHRKARLEWGYGQEESLSPEELIARKVPRHPPGLRLSGLPRPHRKATLFDLLDAEKATGIRLTETFAMWPAAAVSGLYFAPSRSALLLGRPHHPRPGRKLRRAEEDADPRNRTLAQPEPGLRAEVKDRRQTFTTKAPRH